MRICVDASSLLLRSAGVKNYTWHWLQALQAELPPHSLRAFPLLGEPAELDHERSVLPMWRTVPRIALLHACNIRHSRLIDLMAGNVDVFHASSLLQSRPRKPRLTGTIYDMTARLMPEVHTSGNILAEARFSESVIERADGLIAISQATKRDAVRLLRLDERRVDVIYPGVDERFFQAAPMVRQRPYVLFVGTIEPRKNIDLLLDAWKTIPESHRAGHDLLLAGPAGWASEKTLARLRSGETGVQYLGYVPEADLPSLTAGASLFVYPSLYEGFGLPLAQAMAAGVPVVTSNISAMPEVAGDAGILVDPGSVSEFASAIQRLLDSESLRKEMAGKAKIQAGKFTWKNSARLSAEFFQRVCGR